MLDIPMIYSVSHDFHWPQPFGPFHPFPTSMRLAASDHSSPTKLKSLASRCTCRDMRSTKSASVAQPSWRQ